MARLPELQKPTLLQRLLFWVVRKTTGSVYNPLKIWAYSPSMLLSFIFFYSRLDRKASPIPAALRSLIQVRISQINHCEFCIDMNAGMLLKRKVSTEKLETLPDWKNSSLFSEL
jgi:AhpD family alkylhydroperoxidase